MKPFIGSMLIENTSFEKIFFAQGIVNLNTNSFSDSYYQNNLISEKYFYFIKFALSIKKRLNFKENNF